MIVDLCLGPIVQDKGEVPHRGVLRVRLDSNFHVQEWIVHTQFLRADNSIDYSHGNYLRAGSGPLDQLEALTGAITRFKSLSERLLARPLAEADQVERFARFASPINPD